MALFGRAMARHGALFGASLRAMVRQGALFGRAMARHGALWARHGAPRRATVRSLARDGAPWRAMVRSLGAPWRAMALFGRGTTRHDALRCAL
jgi:hypothetical protein